jgi:hypothetical protein
MSGLVDAPDSEKASTEPGNGVAPETNGGEPSPGLRNSKGWDGKLRLPRNALLSNPEALSDPEYSDDDNVVPGDEISADEGIPRGP